MTKTTAPGTMNDLLMAQAEIDKLKNQIQKMKYLNITNDKLYSDLRKENEDLKFEIERLKFNYDEVNKDSKAKGQRLICLMNNNTKLSVDLKHSEKVIKEIEKEFNGHVKECDKNLNLMKELSEMNEELAKQLKEEREKNQLKPSSMIPWVMEMDKQNNLKGQASNEAIMKNLIEKNNNLEKENEELTEKLKQEREKNKNYKIEIHRFNEKEKLKFSKSVHGNVESLIKENEDLKKYVERLKFLAGETTKKIEKRCGCSVYDACIH